MMHAGASSAAVQYLIDNVCVHEPRQKPAGQWVAPAVAVQLLQLLYKQQTRLVKLQLTPTVLAAARKLIAVVMQHNRAAASEKSSIGQHKQQPSVFQGPT